MTKTITYNIRHHLRKLISIVVILSFTTTNVYGYAGPTLFKKKSHAQRYLKDEARKDYGDVVSSPSLLGISQNLGQVVEWHKADADKGRLIIHIQDHHADPTAQLNIAGVLDELTQKYDTHLMCLEGASRELDTAFYDKFEDGKIKEKVARFFVEKGLFTGAEYFKVTRKDLYLKAKGAEDENLYIKHLASYKKNQPNKTEHLRQLSSIRNSLNQLKQKAYSKDLKQIDSVSTSYALKQIKLPKYLRTLARYAKKTKIGTSEYKDLKGFLALLDKEKDIDFKKAEAQRELLIKELAKTLKEEELKGLVVKSLNFRLNKISTEAFYAYLKDLHTQTQQKSQPYKELLSYIDYLKFSKTINHLNLFDEAEDLDEKIKAALCKNNTQRKLAAYSKATKLLNDLYSLKLTRKHLDYIESHPEVYDIANIASFLKDACPRYGLNAPTVIARSEATKQSLSFYTLALERDKALIDNTLKNMKRHRKDKAALVTGGFHTQGITNILKEKNISYVVICPNIDTEEREALYDAKMAGSLPGIPEMAEFFTQMLNTPLVTASGTSKQAVHAQRMFASLFCGATIFDTLDGDMLKRAVARKLLILQGLQQAASSEDPLTAKGADRIVRSCLEMEHVPEPAQQLRASSSGEMLALIGETVPPPIEIKIEKKGTASDGKKAASSGEALRSATEYLVAAGQTVFVTVACKLNVDRSPLAEGIIRRNLSNDLKGVVEIESCGTDVEEAGAEPRAKDACEARGIELSSRGAQQLTQEMADKADIIIAVHEKQQQRIEELFPDAKHKIRLIHMISTMDEIVGAGIVGNDPLRAHHIKQVEEAMDDINGWISEAIIAKVAAKASSAGTPAINWAVNNIEELEQACRQAMTEFNNEFPEDYLKKLQRAHRGIIASINKYMRTLRRDSLTYRILEDYRSKLEQDHNDAMDTAYVYCYANWPDETVASSELSVSAVVHGGFKRPAAYDENSQKAEDVLSEWQDDALSAVLEARDATRAAVWQAERDLYENIVAMDSAEKAAASAEEQLENVSESLAHKETFLSKKYEDAVQDETSVAKRVLIKRLVSDVAQLTDEKEALEEQALEQRRLQSQAAERLPGLQKQVLDQGRELQGLEDEINRMLGLRFDDATDEFVCFEEHLYWHIFLGANRTDASEQIVKDAIRESLGQAETATARGFQELACREMAEEMSQSERIDTGNAIGLERLLTHIARNSHAQAIVAQACGADFAKLHKRHRLFKALRKIAATLALGGAIVWGVHKRLQVEQPPAPKPVTRSLTMLHLRKEEIEAMPEYHKKGEEGEEAEGAKKKTPRQLLTGAMAGAGHIAAASRKYSEERKKALERRREKLANMEARLKELRIREKKLAQSVPMLPEELSQELDVLAESAAKLDDSLRKERVDERVFPDKLYDVLAGEKDTKAETAAAVAREREKEVQEDLASMSRAFKESAAAYADGADAPHSGPRIIAYTKGGKRYLTETVYGIVNPPKGKFFLEDSKWGLWATGKAGSATVFSTMCPSMPGMLAFPAQNVVRIPVFPGHVIESIKTELENVNGRVYFDRANSMWAVVFSGYPKYIEIGMRLAQQGEIEELPQMQIDPEVADTWQDSLPDEMREILSIARGMPVEQRQIIREMVLGMFFGTENTYLRQLSEEEPDFVKMSFTYFAHKCDGFEKVHAFVSHGLRLPTQAHYGFKDANKDGVFVELEGHAWAQTPHGTEDVGTLARIFSSQSGKKFNRAEHLKELAWIKKTAEYRRQQMEGVLELVRQMKNSIAFEAQIKQEKKATVAAEAAFAQEGWKKSYFDLQRFYHAKLSFFEPRAIFTPAEAHEFLQEAMQARHELQGLVGKDAEFMALSHFLFTSINRVKNAFPELAGIADLVKRELAQDIDNALPKDRRLKEPIGPWAEPIVVGSGYNADVLEHAALLRKRLPLAPEMIDIRNDPEGSLRSLGLGADGVNRLKQGEIVFSPDGMFTYQLNSAADHLYVWTPEDNLAVSDTVTGEEIENLALASGELSRITDYVQGLAAYGIARPVTLAASTGAFPANAQAYAKTQSVAGSRWFDFWASQPQPSVLVSATMFNRAKSVKIHSPLSMKGDWLAEITFEDGTVVFDGPMADEADVRSDGQQIKQYKERQGLWFFPDGTWLGLVRDLSGKFRFIGTISFSTGARIDDFEMDDCHAVFCRETGEWWALGKVNGKWVKFEVIREGIGSSHKGRSQLDFGLTGLEGVKSIGAIVHPDKDAWIAHVLLETGVWVRRGPGIKQFNLAADDTFTQKTYDEAHMRYERNMGLYGYRVTEYERCYEIFVQERTNRAGVRVGVCSGEETKRLRVGGKALSERGWETITMPYLMPDGRYDYRLLIDDNQLMYLGGSFAEEFNLNNRAFRYIEKDGLHKPRIRFFGEDGWAIMVTHLKGHVGVIYKPSGSQQVHEKSFEGLATELQMLRWIKDFVCSEDGSWAMSYFSTGGYKIRGSAAVMAQIGGPQYFRSVYGLYLQDGIFLKAFVKQGGKLKVLSALGEQELPAHLQSYDFYKLHVADNEGNWMIEMRKVAGNKTLFQFYGPLANKLRRQSDQLGDPLLQFSGESGRHTEVKKLDNGTIVAVITGDVDIQRIPPIGSSVGLRENPLADNIVFSTDPQADFLTRLEGMYDIGYFKDIPEDHLTVRWKMIGAMARGLYPDDTDRQGDVVMEMASALDYMWQHRFDSVRHFDHEVMLEAVEAASVLIPRLCPKTQAFLFQLIRGSSSEHLIMDSILADPFAYDMQEIVRLSGINGPGWRTIVSNYISYIKQKHGVAEGEFPYLCTSLFRYDHREVVSQLNVLLLEELGHSYWELAKDIERIGLAVAAPNILRDCPLGIELQELDQETISSYCAALHTAENDFYDVEAASSAREDLRFKAIQAIRDNYESFKLNWPVVGKEATAERNRIIRRNRINERLSNIFQGQGRRYRPEGEISRPDPLMTALGEQVIDAVEKLGAAEEYLARGGATLGEGDRLDILRLLVSIRTQIDTRREELAKMRAGLNRPVAAVEIDGGRTIEDMWATLLAELGKDAIFWAFIVGLLYYLTGERARRADLPFIPVVIKDGRPRLTTQGRKLFDKVLGNMEEGPAKEHIIALFTEIMAVQEGLLSDTQKERMDSMRAALPIRERVTHDLLSCVLFEPPQQGRNRYVRLLNIMPFAVVSQLHSPKQQRLRSAHSKELEQLLEDMHENNLTFMEFHRRLYDIAQRHCLEVDGESRKVEPASASDVEERLRSAYKDIPAVQVGPAASYSTKADGWPLSIRGQSGDYLDTRPYVSGDDLRRADWKAYGRTDRLSVKQTDEDRKNMMHILVDMGTAFEAEDTDKWMLDTARSLIAVLDQSRVFGKKAYTLDRLVFIMPDPDDEPVVINVEAMRTKGFDTLLRLLIAQHEEAKERADGIPGRQLTPRAYLVKDKNGELVEVVTDKKGKEHATRYRETDQGRRYRQRTEGVFEVSTLERIERQLAKINGHLAVSGAKQALCVGIEEDAISGASDLLAERGIRSLYWNDKSQALPAEIYLAEEAQAQEAVAVSPDTQKASASGIPTGEFKAIDPALVAPFDGMLERAEELGISLPTLRAQVKNLHTGQGEEITITAYRREPHYELLGGDDKSSGGDYGAPLKKTRNIGIMLDDSLLLVAESKDGAEGIIRFSPVLEQERVAKIFTEYDGQAPEQVLLLTGMEVAPDNQFGADSRRLKGIGTLLVAAAIESSIDSSVIREDQKGNIIATNVGRLSASIEDPHGFYERIGMVPIGNDTYYFSDERAMEFLNRVRADHALEIASKAASAGLNSIKLKYPQHIDLIDELAKDDLFGEDLLLVVSRESSGDFKNTLDHISGNWEGFKATFSQLARPDSIGIEILREVFRNRPGAFAGALSRISSNWERFSTTFNQLAQPDSIGIETLREVFRNSPGAFADALNSISSNWERFSTTFNQLAHPDSIGIDALREAFRDSPNGFVGALNSIPNNWDIFNQLAQPGSIGIDVLREAFRSDSRGFENALNSISRDWERFNKLVQPELLGINILRVIFRYYAASLANLDAIGSICEQLKSEEEYLLAFPETEEAFKEFDTEGLSMGPRTYVKLLIYDRLAQDRAMPANFRTQLQEEVIPALRIIDRTFDGYPTLGMQQQDGWKKDDRENMMFALLQVIMGNFLSSAEFPRQISRSTWGAINNTCRVNIPATAYPIFGLLAQELHRMKWLKPGKPYVVNVAGDHLKEAAFLIPCLFFASLPVGQISSMPEDLPVQPKGYTFYLVESVIPARSGDSGAKSMRTNFFHSFMALVNSDYGAANDIVLLEDLERAFLLTTAAAAFLRTYGIEDSELSQLYTDFKEDIEAFLKERARMSEEEVQRLFRKAQAAQRDVIGVDLSQMRDALRQIGRFFREDLGEGAINYGIFRQKIEQFTQRVQGHLFPADESAGIIIDAAKTRDWQTIIDIAPSGGAPKAASSGLDEIKAKFPDYAELIDELSRDDSLGEDTVIEASGNDLFYRGLIMIAANRDGLSTAKDGFRTALNRLKAPEYFGIDMLRQVFVDSPFGFAIAINSISAEWEIFNQLAAPDYFGIDMLRQWFRDSPLLFGRNLYSIGEDWGQFSIASSHCRESDSLDIEIFGQAFGGDLFDCSRVLRVVAENWENFLQLEKGLGSEVSKVLFRYHQGSLANLLLILEQLKQKKDYILAFAKAEEIFEEFSVEDLSIGAQSYVKLLIFDRLVQDKIVPEYFKQQLGDVTIPALRIVDTVSKKYPTLGMELQDKWEDGDKDDMAFSFLQILMGNFLRDVQFEHELGESGWYLKKSSYEVRVPPATYPIFILLAEQLRSMAFFKPSRPYMTTVAGDYLQEAPFLVPCLFFSFLPQGNVPNMPEYDEETAQGYNLYPGVGGRFVGATLHLWKGDLLDESDPQTKGTQTNFYHAFMALVNKRDGAPYDTLLQDDLERTFLLSTAAAASLGAYGIEDPVLARLYADFRVDMEEFLERQVGIPEEDIQKLSPEIDQGQQEATIESSLGQIHDPIREMGKFFREDFGDHAINHGIFKQKVDGFTRRVNSHLFSPDSTEGRIVQAAKARDWQTIIDIAPSEGTHKAASSGLDEIKEAFPQHAELIDILASEDSLGEDTLRQTFGDNPEGFAEALNSISENWETFTRLAEDASLGIDTLRQGFGNNPWSFTAALNFISWNWEIFTYLTEDALLGIDTLRQLFGNSPECFEEVLDSISENWEIFTYLTEDTSLGIDTLRQGLGNSPWGFAEALNSISENWEIFTHLAEDTSLGIELLRALFLYHTTSFISFSALVSISGQLEQKKDYILSFVKAEEALKEFDVKGLSIGAQSYVKLLIFDRIAQDRVVPEYFKKQLRDSIIPALMATEETTKNYPTLGMELQDKWQEGNKDEMVFSLLQIVMGNFLKGVQFEHQLGASEWNLGNQSYQVRIPPSTYPIFILLVQKLHNMNFFKPNRPYMTTVAGDYLQEAPFLVPCLFFSFLPEGKIPTIPEYTDETAKGYNLYPGVGGRFVGATLNIWKGDLLGASDPQTQGTQTNFFHAFMALLRLDDGQIGAIDPSHDLERTFLFSTAAAASLGAYAIEDRRLSELYTQFKADIMSFLIDKVKIPAEEVPKLFPEIAEGHQYTTIKSSLGQMHGALRYMADRFREDPSNHGRFQEIVDAFTRDVSNHLFPRHSVEGRIVQAAKATDWQAIIDIAPSGGTHKAASAGLDEIKEAFPQHAEFIDELARDDLLGEEVLIDTFRDASRSLKQTLGMMSRHKENLIAALTHLGQDSSLGIEALRQKFRDNLFYFGVSFASIAQNWDRVSVVFAHLSQDSSLGIKALRQGFDTDPWRCLAALSSLSNNWYEFNTTFTQLTQPDLFDGMDMHRVLFSYHPASFADLDAIESISEQLKQKKDYLLTFAKAEETFEEFDVEGLSIGAQSYVKLLIFDKLVQDMVVDTGFRLRLETTIIPALRIVEAASRQHPTLGMELQDRWKEGDNDDMAFSVLQIVMGNFLREVQFPHALGQSEWNVNDRNYQVRIPPTTYPIYILLVQKLHSMNFFKPNRPYMTTVAGDYLKEAPFLVQCLFFSVLPAGKIAVIPEYDEATAQGYNLYPGVGGRFVGATLNIWEGGLLDESDPQTQGTQTNFFHAFMALLRLDDGQLADIDSSHDLERTFLLSKAAAVSLRAYGIKDRSLSVLYTQFKQDIMSFLIDKVEIPAEEIPKLFPEITQGPQHTTIESSLGQMHGALRYMADRFREDPSNHGRFQEIVDSFTRDVSNHLFPPHSTEGRIVRAAKARDWQAIIDIAPSEGAPKAASSGETLSAQEEIAALRQGFLTTCTNLSNMDLADLDSKRYGLILDMMPQDETTRDAIRRLASMRTVAEMPKFIFYVMSDEGKELLTEGWNPKAKDAVTVVYDEDAEVLGLSNDLHDLGQRKLIAAAGLIRNQVDRAGIIARPERDLGELTHYMLAEKIGGVFITSQNAEDEQEVMFEALLANTLAYLGHSRMKANSVIVDILPRIKNAVELLEHLRRIKNTLDAVLENA